MWLKLEKNNFFLEIWKWFLNVDLLKKKKKSNQHLTEHLICDGTFLNAVYNI